MRWENTETPTFAGAAGSNKAPAVAETMELLDRDGNEVATFTKSVDGQPLVYRALLTQSGTDAPVATVLENTLGGTVVWGYTATGEYTATLTGAFTTNKTFITATSSAAAGSNSAYFIGASSPDADTVKIVSIKHDGTLADEFLVNASVEILVYP